MASEDLRAPLLLIAMPQILDPFFFRSVVLLVHHDDEGSIGFIVNRPTAISLGEILGGMELAWSGDDATVAFFGGPVQPQLGTVLYGGDGGEGNGISGAGVTRVTPEIALTQHVNDLEELAAAPPERLRLCLGYAGWGAGQLVEEILRNDWLVAQPEGALVFASDADSIWEKALRTVGVDPASLPAWGPAEGGGPLN